MRVSRGQQQARTRTAVLVAARAEFAEHGYAEAKINRIAERAELTRGAVYSNFTGKRALYLAVLLAAAQPAPDRPGLTDQPDLPDQPGLTDQSDLPDAVEAFARLRLDRLPMATGAASAGRLAARSLTGVFDDERGRAALAQITRLEALLLSHALGRGRRSAELILTMLHGAATLAETAPGFGDPFDVARACRHLAGLDLPDTGDPPHLPFVPAARPVREPWHPPGEMTDELSGRPVTIGDGIVVALGTGRLGAAEEAARLGEDVTVALVSDDPAETGALVRLRVTDLTASLRRVFGPAIRPSLRLVLDDQGTLASAIGAATTFETETSVRVRGGEVVSRADGRGATYAVATAGDER
ncbi:TetR family transcriptional regulator [Paractinoplanes maris]|uniref:TetR family transcriptional regulator n=1 Tax=Paractinoplanes maris TaxID=1734446 RepID=UPI0020203DAC|nr:TetR family transcriptional regulator [Actinoplanes maris]